MKPWGEEEEEAPSGWTDIDALLWSLAFWALIVSIGALVDEAPP